MAASLLTAIPDDVACEVPPAFDFAGVAAFYRAMYDTAAAAVTAKVRLVSPTQAQAYLLRNDHNRPLSPLFATRYAELIRTRQWKVNGQGLILDGDGAMLDGQHRCNGIVIAGVSVPLLVVEGVSKDVFDTIDQGRKRNFAGYLAINGEVNTYTLAAAVRQTLALLGGEACDIEGEFAYRPTISQLFTVLDIHPGLRDSVSYVHPHHKRKMVMPGPFAALHYLTTRRHPTDAARTFWDQLLTGANLAKGSPVYKLRDALTDNASGSKTYSPRHIMAFVIKAFNATVRGKALGCLKYDPDVEDFPEIA